MTKINSELGFSQKKIFAAGSFVSENLLSNFKINAKFNSAASKPDSFLELASPAAQIRISGNFASENLGIFSSDFNGKIEGEITEFKTFYKSYIGGDNPIAEKFRINGKPIKISAEIVSKAGETGIKNLILSSPLVNGKGEIDLDFTRNFPEIDVDLTLDNLDLDSILSNDPTSVSSSELRQNNNSNSVDEVAETLPQKSESAEQQKSELIVDDLTKKIDLSLAKEIKNFDLNAEIKIDSIEFLSGQIRDANLYLKISREGEVIISPLIFTVPGQGKFRVSGVLDNSQVLPKFVGKLDANGQSLKEIFNWLKIESQNLKFENLKNYQIYSDILLVPNLTKFSNFYLSLGQDSSEFLGELTLDNSDKTPSIKSRFRGNNFNVDDYFLTSTGNLYLSSGSLIKKLFWLNEINVSADFDLSFDKLIYAGEEFLNQSMKLKFGRGYIQVDDMKLLSEQTDLTANILVDISEKSPQFMLNVAAKNFHYEAAQDPEKTTKKNFFDQFFNLPSLAGFNGQVNTNFANLKLGEVFTKNVKLAAKLVDGNFKNTEFSCDLYGGNFTYTGLIGIGSSKVINGNVTFNNVVLKEFLPNAFGVKNISGIANFAANINASASQKSEFAKLLNSEINFSISAPTIEGYGLNDLVKKMFAPRLNVQELREPEKILINSVSYTAFQKASGSIKFNDGEGKVSAKVSGVAINGVLTGTIDAPQNSANLLFNVIFLTGTRQKQTPINIASSVSGKLDDLGQSINIDQVRQYFGLPKISTPAPQSQLEQQPTMPNQLKSQIIQPTPAQ